MFRNLLLAVGILLGIAACGGSGGPAVGQHGIDIAAFELELSALTTPPGVDPQLWASLKDGLRDSVLAGAGNHEASRVPTDAVTDVAIVAINEDGSIELAWTYLSSGDYNQDKLVNVMDLTPLGMFFGVKEGDDNWPQAVLADGNRNGVIEVMDITVLGLNYLNRVEGYRLYTDAEGTVGDQRVLFEESFIPDETFCRRFSYTVAEPTYGDAFVVRPYDGDEIGPVSNQAYYADPQPDVSVTVPDGMLGGVDAQWEASWSGGVAPFTIIWEFAGGADHLGYESAANPSKRTFEMLNDSRTDPVNYHYEVSVEDSHGFIGTAQGDYTVGVNPHPLLTLTMPEDMRGERYASWAVSWEWGVAPYILDCRFNGGGQDWTSDEMSATQYTTGVKMFNDDPVETSVYDYEISVTDANGYSTTATGEYSVGPTVIPQISISVPDSMSGGQVVTWTADVAGGTGPYRVIWQFDGGAADVGPQEGIIAQSQVDVEMINHDMVNDRTYSFTVHAKDSLGSDGIAEGEYTVGPGPNQLPVIEVAAFHCEDQTMDIVVSDPNPDESFTVTVTEAPGFTVDQTTKLIPGDGASTAHFDWAVEAPMAGRSGMSAIMVEDSHGGISTTTVQLVMPLPDTLYAVPMKMTVEVGEPVPVLVLTGGTSDPFRNACMVSITCELGSNYVTDSRNAGAFGGSGKDPDGIWALMDPVPANFSAGVGRITQIDNGDGRDRYEFTWMPSGGSDLLDTFGDLFNFQLSFDTPGTYTLRFVESTGGINRTYFEDWDEYGYFWPDIANERPGLVTSITVEAGS